MPVARTELEALLASTRALTEAVEALLARLRAEEAQERAGFPTPPARLTRRP